MIGSVWATKKAEGISGKKLLVIDIMQRNQNQVEKANLLVAADIIGAGVGDMVLVCRGNPARIVVGDGKAPVDAAVVGIVDSLVLSDENTL